MRTKGILAALVFVCGATAAHADSYTFNFCPGNDSCPADLTEASIAFVSMDATDDPNDYTVTVRFIGTLTNMFIDTIDFTTGIELASLPTLTAVPSGTVLGDWTTRYDKVNAAAGANCSGTMSNHLFVCSKATTGNGPDLNGTNEWVYSVDFLGDAVVDANSPVDLRALFVNEAGTKKGLMSPDGVVTTTTTETPTTGETPTTSETPTTTETPTTSETPTTGNVPEPAMLSLLGVGLALTARHLRNQTKRS